MCPRASALSSFARLVQEVFQLLHQLVRVDLDQGGALTVGCHASGDKSLVVTEIALVVDFRSLRRFNAGSRCAPGSGGSVQQRAASTALRGTTTSFATLLREHSAPANRKGLYLGSS